MSTRNSIEKWLLVQWSSGGRAVVNAKDVGLAREPKVGTVVNIPGPDGARQNATVIGNSRDRIILDQQVSPRVYEEETQAGPSGRANSAEVEEPKDFTASDSDDWEPSGNEQSSSEDDNQEVENKRSKLDRFKKAYSNNRRTSKVLKPSHRADAVNVILNNRKRTMDARNSLNLSYKTNDKSKSESTSKSKFSETTVFTKQDLIEINNRFQKLFKALREMRESVEKETGTYKDNISNVPKPLTHKPSPKTSQVVTPRIVKVETKDTTKTVGNKMDVDVQQEENNDEYSFRSDESCRSDDNVLITNKYNTPNVTTSNKVLSEQQKNVIQKKALEQKDDWIPIGSGQTLIHKEQYRSVNWKSYTVATRSLLMAVFPRKILATHSLTGKASPAFTDKPAKMLLNPKIVSDIVIEVADRFKVRDNLVRTVITTKCADESKMYRMRIKRKTLPPPNENQENTAPNTPKDPNQTL